MIVPDVLQSELDVVFCGTAPSAVSAARRAYYAHPGNRFWRTLAEVGLTPQQLAPEAYPELPRYGIGLTDIAKHHSGQDADLPPEAFDATALRAKIERYRPSRLAFTSKRAAREFLGRMPERYGPIADRVGETQLWVLPSTSGLAVRWFSIEPWRRLAAELR